MTYLKCPKCKKMNMVHFEGIEKDKKGGFVAKHHCLRCDYNFKRKATIEDAKDWGIGGV